MSSPRGGRRGIAENTLCRLASEEHGQRRATNEKDLSGF
tara:strand:+ start:488 stop:604 length:117 start_codon:yes stop_codon:yes gene_type:complete